MPVLLLLLWFAIIGLVAWLLIKFIPMPQAIQTLIVIAAAVACVLILLQAMGVGLSSGPTVPKVR
jgi:hypothetical protein